MVKMLSKAPPKCGVGDDLVWAMGTLGFDDYVNPLKVYLTKYRQAARVEKVELPADEHTLKATKVS